MIYRLALLLLLVSAIPALAAPSQIDSVANERDQRPINLDVRPAQVSNETASSGNPLWAIPFGSLSITRDRPIFTPSRRPPAPAVIAVPQIAPVKQVVRLPEPQRPNFTLVGTVIGEAEGIAVFLDQSTQRLVRLKTGEGYSGWILRSVKTREATLEKGAQTELLSLPVLEQANQITR